MFEARSIIGWSKPDQGAIATFDRDDPGTAITITRAQATSVADASEAANAAAAAFGEWSAASAETRSSCLLRAAELLADRSDDLIAAAGAEVGAVPDWVRFNIKIAQDTLVHAASLSGCLGVSLHKGGNPEKIYTQVRKSAGVVLGIAPWNAPIALVVRAIAAPLALGNTVVLKGSELCPRTHELVARVLIDAGLPEGVLNYITHAPVDAHAIVETLIAHPAVRRVNFTGSTRVGREVAIIAARNLKTCLLELSGKAPCIVLADADTEKAARLAVGGAFFNQGQICMSTDRAIVVESQADAFVAAAVRETEALCRQHDVRLISADAVLRVKGLIDDAITKGARPAFGGAVGPTTLQPAILDNVSYGMRVYSEETFGPVLSVIRVADAEEAISVANDTEYALAAAVHGVEEVEAIAARVEAGVVHINGSTVYDDPALPFGGLKASGYGRFGGETAIHEFTETQFITKDRPVNGAEGG